MLIGIMLNECRHTFASKMIVAGCNAQARFGCLGTASIAVTVDRCGQLDAA